MVPSYVTMDQHSASFTYEQRIAHVVWAAHILSYLTRGRSHTTLLLPELDDDEDFDADILLDAETDKARSLVDSDPLLRFKFLDCVAELFSPSKGWQHVVATGLRESEDFVNIDVARNDGFDRAQSYYSVGESDAEVADLDSYLGHVQNYLLSTIEQGDESVNEPSGRPSDFGIIDIHSQSGASLNWFECVVINFNGERIDYWVEKLRSYVTGRTPSQEHDEERSAGLQKAVKTWTNIADVLSHPGTRSAIFREQMVRSAYECVLAGEVYQLLQTMFGSRMGAKIWNALRFLARPISNCRLLSRIASQLPHFRTVKFFPIPPEPETKLNPEYLVDITDAWGQLVSISPSRSEMKAIAKFRDMFKRDCARSFGSHAEVQLFLHYKNNVSQTPSIDYFGCSKKTCFLCEVFLRATSHPISTRGRHGVCYPAWGVPFSKSTEAAAALLELERVLVSRIDMQLKGQPGEAFLDLVPQSTLISDFQALLSQEEISRKDGMKKSFEEKRKILQRERRIL